MHLCIDARIFSPKFTGIGRYTHELVKQFLILKPDWKFTLFLENQQYNDFIAEIKNNALYANLDIQLLEANEKMYSWQEQTTFLTKLNKIDADVFWFPHFNVPYFFNKNFVVTVHDLTLSKFPGKKMNSFIHRFVYFKILRHALKKSKHILTVSENTKHDIVSDENIDAKKITIAHNAVGKEFFEYKENYNNIIDTLNKKSEYFLYTGQHREHKNVITLVKAFHIFLQNHKNYKLILTGKPNPLYPEVQNYIQKNSLEKNIILAGLVSEAELLQLYKNAKCYIFPSFYEGFGIPPLEAMSLNTPVIASNSSCIPEICENAALYFDPNNTSMLTEKMEELVKNKWLQEKLIEEGKVQVKKYNWKKSAEIILKKFEELV